MANNIYFSMKSSGEDVPLTCYETKIGGVDLTNMSQVLHLDWGIRSPMDAMTGMATGRHVHATVNISRACDKATPVVQKSLSENLVVDLVIKIFSTNRASGSLEHSMTIATTEGRCSDYRIYAQEDGTMAESMSFTYSTIHTTHEVEGVEQIISRTDLGRE